MPNRFTGVRPAGHRIERFEGPRHAPPPDLRREIEAHYAALYPASVNAHFNAAPESHEVIHFAASASGGTIGWASLVPEGEEGEIRSVFVAARARGAGIASALIEAVESESHARNLRVIRLETGTSQPEAIDLYLSLGYEPCGPFGRHSPHPLSRFMEKRLR